MVTNYYNSSNNYSSPIHKGEPKPYENNTKICDPKPVLNHKTDTDKILLLGLLAVLYLTNCDDVWLLLAILYLAFS